MNNWTLRLRQSHIQRKADRVELLPLPKPVRDGFSLQCHLQLEALRTGNGSLMSLQLLMRVALATAVLQQLGYGNSPNQPIEEYEAAAAAALGTGSDGSFQFDQAAFQLFARLLTNHDQQLNAVPIKALAYVEEKLRQYSKAA
ncbi:Fis family transcriptional regulator [Massilia sp. LjRoot122]|uniref:Fis family transcriptional regulator n=1 Tax=Massilia sp. LjRoot122 TaxID=3342257 RepID=UPI003ECFBBE7